MIDGIAELVEGDVDVLTTPMIRELQAHEANARLLGGRKDLVIGFALSAFAGGVAMRSTPYAELPPPRAVHLERELQVEAHLGIFEVGAAEQLLDALQAMISVLRCTSGPARHACGSRQRAECIQGAHELGAAEVSEISMVRHIR
jgi:hypothetical protein